MALTKLNPKQIKDSTNPGSLIVSDSSNNFTILSPTLGADHLWFYDHSATAFLPLTVGTNLSISGTTINASAGAGGYSDVQEEGSGFTNSSTNTKLNFIGTGLTAADQGAGITSITLNTFLNTLATAGTILLSSGNVTGTLPVVRGGTGITAGTSGGILGFTATGTIASSALLTANALVLGGGAGATPSTPLGLGTTTTVLHGNAGGAPTWGAVSLTADVSGALPVINGGTNLTSYTIGDLIYASGTTTLSKLADVAVGSVLKSGGVATAPSWGTLASTDLSNSSSIVLTTGTQSISGTKTFSSNITLSATPSAGTDVTNVTYVTTAIGNAIAGLRKGSVRAATTAAGTLASSFENGDVIDGVTLVTGDLILIKDQAAPAQNGVYTVNASGAPTRATWMDAASEIDGVYVAVEDGTANVGTLWITVSEVTTLNTDSIVFTQIQTSGTVGGTGVANKVAYWSGTNTLTSTNNFHFNGTQLAIGTTGPAISTVLTTVGAGAGNTTFGIKHHDSGAQSVFSVADDGTTTVGFGSTNVITGSSMTANNGSGYLIYATGANLNLSAAGSIVAQGGGSSSLAANIISNNTRSSTSSNQLGVQFIGQFSPVGAGTNTYTELDIAPIINQTTHTGATRSVYIHPALTSVGSGGHVALTITASGQTALHTTAGKVRFDLGSDASYDLFYRGTGGELIRLGNGTTGQVLTATTSAAPTWTTPASATTVTRAYLTGSTSSVIDLDSGTGVTDIDGSNVVFTVPTDLEKTFVVRNGQVLSRSGSVSRDYTLVSATGVLTLAYALTADESLLVYKID